MVLCKPTIFYPLTIDAKSAHRLTTVVSRAEQKATEKASLLEKDARSFFAGLMKQQISARALCKIPGL